MKTTLFEEAPATMRNLSVSKIEKALMCPLSMRFQYIDKIPQPSGWKLVAGNVIHEILERALRQVAKTDRYPDAKEMDDMFEPVWKEKVEEEEKKPWFIGWQEDPKDPPEKIKREYRPLVALARNEVLPTLKPWMIGDEPMVEYKVDLEMQSPWGPFQLIGYIDLVSASGILMDWKTTEARENEDGIWEISARSLRTWLQFAAYSLLVWPIVGEEVVRCEKIFLVRGQNGKPYVQRAPFEVGRKHREWFVRQAAQVWGMVKTGIFLGNTDHWYCKPGWCPFFAGCQGEVTMEKK